MIIAEKRYIELFLKSSPSGRPGSFRGKAIIKYFIKKIHKISERWTDMVKTF